MAEGTLRASKGRQPDVAANDLHVVLRGWRLRSVDSDVILTLTTPTFLSACSAAAEHAGVGAKTKHVTARALLESIAQSFQIRDAALFGPASRAANQVDS